ncbi:MAG: cobalt-precorrin-4 C(11)-methyltransferase [bacterium]|nr:MAG: cobalt-precorrin-4 C(11)-methyltransferase [bacterium]
MPKKVLKWANDEAHVQSSENMDYNDIFTFIEEHVKEGIFVRLHTGDPSIYSTIARQIDFLKSKAIEYEVIPGVTAAFAAASSLGIEYTIPGLSQTLIISRIPGNTPNPEPLINLLNCKNSSLVFYLSVRLMKKLKETAINEVGYAEETPCWVIEKASWPEERVIKGTLKDITIKVDDAGIKGNALVFLGDFLHQKETVSSHLYSKKRV